MLNNFEEFFKEAFQVNALEMKEKEEIDVGSFNVGVLSFNIKDNINEYKKVIRIIRKPDSKTYIFNINSEEIEVSPDHKFFAKLEKEPAYITASDLFKASKKNKIYLFSKENIFEEVISIKQNKTKVPIFDMEVEENHNFFTNGYLSHNTLFGSPEVVAGGEASKYYSSIRLDIRKSILKDGDEAYANKTRVKVVKNKVGIPYRTAEFEIVYNEGINKIQEVIDLGGDCEVLKKWGSQITYLDVKYPIEEFKEMLKNEEFYEEIRQKIINKLYI